MKYICIKVMYFYFQLESNLTATSTGHDDSNNSKAAMVYQHSNAAGESSNKNCTSSNKKYMTPYKKRLHRHTNITDGHPPPL